MRILTASYSWAPFVAVLLAYTADQIRWFGTDVGSWDVLLLSAWATVACGLALAQTLPGRLERMLVRLVNRGALESSPEDVPRLLGKVGDRAARWGRFTGAFVAVVIGAAFLAAFSGAVASRLLLVVLAVAGGWVAGFQLGRMVGYGQLGRVLRNAGAQVRVTAGHLDGVGGLKPVGEYFLFQAMVAAIPAVFLAAWWLLIPLRGDRYEHWRDPYLGMLAVAIVIQLLAFIVPLWSFHRAMAAQKTILLQDADRLSVEIASLSERLAAPQRGDKGPSREHPAADELRKRLDTITERYWAIERLPTWPVDVKTRRRFRLNNLALVLPLAGKLVGESPVWQQLADVLRGLGQ